MVTTRRVISPAKGKRIPGACDICKRKKIKCDSGERMGKWCTNCETAGFDCTHRETTKALGPAKSYVANLEMRLEKMEKVLNRLLPGVDLNAELDHLADMPESQSTSPSFVSSESPEPSGAQVVRHDNEDCIDKALMLKLQRLDLSQPDSRFFGGSSGFRLIQTALDFKNQYMNNGQFVGDHKTACIFNPCRRREFWVTLPWQRGKLDEELNLDASKLTFPEDDLFVSLVDFYFKEVNILFPLLHRPTFERQIAERLHTRDAMFGNVVLLVCALGSKYSDDPRIYLDSSNTRSAGHKWYKQVDTCRKAYITKSSLHELQMIALLVLFGKSTGRPHGSWVHVGLGLKLAQEMGMHRRRPGKDGQITAEDELWKRAFWVLLAHDRLISTAFGRPCTIHEEDYDLDYPVECDDEYWDLPDSSKSFQQPPDKPSTISYFNCFLRLIEMMGNIVRLLYTNRKSTSILGLDSEEEAIAHFDSALNQWIDCVPDHLRWNSNRQDSPVFGQSGALYLTYYGVQILIHRPFIPSLNNPSPTGFPSLAICTNAARSSCCIFDAFNKSNILPPPFIQSWGTHAALVLLVNVWSSKRSGLEHNHRRELSLIKKVLDMLDICEPRWSAAGRVKDIITELASFSDVVVGTSRVKNSQDDTPSSNTSASNSPDVNGTMAYQREYVVQANLAEPMPVNGGATTAMGSQLHPPQANFTLPVYSNELGQIPVFGQFGSVGAPLNEQLPAGDLSNHSDRLFTQSANTFYGNAGSAYQAPVLSGMNEFREFGAQSSGGGWPQGEQKIWQMMGMDDVDMWLASTNVFEWENIFMPVDQQENVPENGYRGP